MAAASCNPLRLSFSQMTILPSISPSRVSTLRFPSRHRCVPICSSSAADRFDMSPAAVVDPALRHANVLFFKSGYNVQIVVEEDEPDEVLLRRFRREVSKVGVIQECKRRRYFENKQEEKKRRARDASRRNRRRRYVPRFTSPLGSSEDGDGPKNAREDDDDNWDLPEGALPY